MLPFYLLRSTFLPAIVVENYEQPIAVSVSLSVLDAGSNYSIDSPVERPIALLRYNDEPTIELSSKQTEQAIADGLRCLCGECLACNIRRAYLEATGRG